MIAGTGGAPWFDEAAVAATWEKYLRNSDRPTADPWGMYSVGQLMKEQRSALVRILNEAGYDLPVPLDPYQEWSNTLRPSGHVPPPPSLGHLGGEWMPRDLAGKLSSIPEEAVLRAWREAFEHAIELVDQMYLVWTTDTF